MTLSFLVLTCTENFVKDYAKIARPLINLTKKDASFCWTSECQDAFELIKSALIGLDVMGYPLNDMGSFYLDTYASEIGIGAVLSQVQQGGERVTAYASQGMKKAEKSRPVMNLIQYFRQYLLLRKLIVRSNHQALVWLFSLKEPGGKITQWIEILAPYNFTIEYRPGKIMGHCDALSRSSTPKDCTVVCTCRC